MYLGLIAFVWAVATLAWWVIRRPRNSAPATGSVSQNVTGAIQTMVGTITAQTVHIGDAKSRAPSTTIEIVYEPQRGEPYSTQLQLGRELWHVYRIGVRSDVTIADPSVRLLDVRKVERSGLHTSIYGLSQLFGPIPCELAPASNKTVNTGAAPTMFDFVKKSIAGDQKIWVCRAEDATQGCLGMMRTYCLHVEAAGGGASDETWFHVWSGGRNLNCERVGRGHEDKPNQVGVEDFSAAPILRWQSPTARIEKVGSDYRVAVDVYCSNEGPRESNARVQDFEAELVGWGLLGFEEFERGTTIYSVHATIDNRFKLKIRQPTSGFSHGHQTISWSIAYTDDVMRAYLTRASIIIDVPGVGPARLVSQALDETTAEERYWRYLDGAPISLRGWSTGPSPRP